MSNITVKIISADEARIMELESTSKANPAKLPKSLQGKLAKGRNRCNFLPKMCGISFMTFENLLYNNTGRLSNDYNGGLWEFSELEAVTGGFFCFPEGDSFECSNALNYAEGFLDGALLGALSSLLTINALAWKTEGAQQEKFTNLYYAVKDYFFDGLYEIEEKSNSAKEILEARQASRMLYRFLD